MDLQDHLMLFSFRGEMSAG